MDGIPSAPQNFLKSDILSAWRAIDHGVVAQNNKTREKYWSHWTTYTNLFKKEPFLKDCTNAEKVIIITAFAARVRKGFYGKGKQVTVQSVTQALAAITKTCELAGEPSPVLQAEKTYRAPVARLVEGFRREDPPATPQLAIPVAVPIQCYNAAYKTSSNKQKAVGDLALIAFYYLLRVGEYTKPKFITVEGKQVRATRTVQFAVENVGFFKNSKILPRTSSLKRLLSADSCTLKITNQKNGYMGETIHQHAIKSTTCPVQALARRVNHILKNDGTPSNLICDYMDEKTNTWASIVPAEMIYSIRSAIKVLKLERKGINPNLVGVHSLRAGGAMAMKMNGASDTTIMKQGRWRSLTFLQYIHNQIAHLTKDLSQQMSNDLPFQNIAAIEKS